LIGGRPEVSGPRSNDAFDPERTFSTLSKRAPIDKVVRIAAAPVQ
jgi:hypothetical protein